MIMGFSVLELLWLFFLYSFFGWILETVFATVREKTFANRGLINGPFCIIYGFAAMLISVTLRGVDGIWLFLGVVIYTTVIEWIAGHLAEALYHEHWWDYSKFRFNLDGYICLRMSLLWGVLGFAAVRWLNDLSLKVFYLIPRMLRPVLIWTLVGILAVDILASYMLLKGIGHLKRWAAVDSQITKMTAEMGKWIAVHIDRRLHKAYPKAQKTETPPKEKTVFAYGCGFYKIVTLFFIGAFLGDLVETVYCRFSLGFWMSRSSVVWGPFSIVWGIAIAAATAMLYKYRNKSTMFLFWAGTLLGGAYEYFCSIFTEIVFGKIFWDYSGIPFNLGGRINLLFCFFWGIAGVVWFKVCYPKVTLWIEKIPIKPGKIITWCLIIFMTANIAMSCAALIRYDERDKGVEAKASWQIWMDEHYPDERMEKIYPKAKNPPKQETSF